ncbi:hypothetical protein U2057_15330, partial [Listeria monocytogenes]|uniref:hypothetical protein n=1 Tax=Listeria monocytogenes TaxID=1639 RepID=UPI002FDBE8F9
MPPVTTSIVERCPCGNAPDRRCDAPLFGKKQGQHCNLPLCGTCRNPRPIGDLCAAHARIEDKKASP